MGESEKYTEAIYTAPETLHSSNNNNDNNRRSHFEMTDLEDSNTSDATLSGLLAPFAAFSIVLYNISKCTRPDSTDLLSLMNVENEKLSCFTTTACKKMLIIRHTL